MNTRIKELRKTVEMTQDAFGQLIGVKKTAISEIESGKNKVSNQIINSILKTKWDNHGYVNEEWLRTGEGMMFQEVTIDEEIADFIGKIQMTDENNFKKRLISLLARLDEDDWLVLEKMAREMAEKKKD